MQSRPISERYKVSLKLGRQIEFIAAHHLIHRKRSPFPEKRVESEEWRVELMALDMRSLAPINERESAFPLRGRGPACGG